MRAHSTLLAIVLAGASACSDDAEPVSPPAPPSSQPTSSQEAAPVEAEPEMVQRTRPMMGTIVQITVAGMPERQAGPLIERALDEMVRLERVLSEWRSDSEMSAINAGAGGPPVRVGPETLEVVQAGLDVSRWSEGAFDLSWAALRGLYTFQPGERLVPALSEVRARLPLVDYARISVDADASTVRLEREGMTIGTGAIAKGYAMDRAGAVLRAGGAESYMIFGGGQVSVHGMRGDRGWRVGIQHPRNPSSYIAFLESTAGSISTSGDYEHAFLDDRGRHWHHIIDTETGLPATRSVQVTVLAKDAMHADALSTAAFILGPERALAMLAEVPGAPEAVIIDPDLRIWTTPGTRDRLRMRAPLEDGRLFGPTAFSTGE